MKAFRSIWAPLDNIEYIIAAPTRGRATTKILNDVKDGYRDAHYGQMRTCRAPEFDHLAQAVGERTTKGMVLQGAIQKQAEGQVRR